MIQYTTPIESRSLFYDFKESASFTKDIGLKKVLEANINNIVYKKCEDVFVKYFDKIQKKVCVGIQFFDIEDINNVCAYLERINSELYKNYLKEDKNNNSHFVRDDKIHLQLPSNKNFKFVCKDGTIITYKRTSNVFGTLSSKIFFYGRHKEKHANFLIKYCNKYRNVSIDTYNFTINKEGMLNLGDGSIDGVSEDAIIFNEKHNIFDYINAWLRSESYFSSRGINHKIGILLYGAPGTGKTTFAKVLATKYNLDLIKLNLSDLSKLITKEEFWDKIEFSVVVLEDIDVLVSKRDESVTSADKENFQALLQLLDGINSCKKTIFLATTNYIDNLDSALIRDGRFDIKIEMKNFDYDEAVKMCNKFEVNSEVILRDENFPINPAYLQNKIVTLQMKEVNEKLKQKAQKIGSNKQEVIE